LRGVTAVQQGGRVGELGPTSRNSSCEKRLARRVSPRPVWSHSCGSRATEEAPRRSGTGRTGPSQADASARCHPSSGLLAPRYRNGDVSRQPPVRAELDALDVAAGPKRGRLSVAFGEGTTDPLRAAGPSSARHGFLHSSARRGSHPCMSLLLEFHGTLAGSMRWASS
jgi:hypothetical protein